MENDKSKSISVAARIGSLVGGICFLVFGLVPGLYFGSFSAVILISKITGGAVEPTVLARIMIIIGSLLGLFCSFAVFIIGGALAGTLLGYLSDAIFPKEGSAANESEGNGPENQ